jgi:ribosomal protein S12 methylthiotransferase
MPKKTDRIRVSFTSLGCFKNVVDTEVLGGMLQKRGVEVVSSYEESDWLIINTCGFIRDAKEESIDEILQALERKAAGEIPRVAVFGCLTQRYHQELRQTFSQADILWGVNNMEELAAIIAGEEKTPYPDKGLFLYDHTHKRIWSTTPNSTFIKISEGCNMPCSFCAIPRIRGPYRSRDLSSILKEAEGYVKRGCTELNIISQNSSHFGREGGGPSRLPDLIDGLAGVGAEWIRILYLMPEEVDDPLIEAFDRPSVLPYFDLPFQHVSPGVLKKMKRSGSPESHMRLIEKIRHRHADAVIRTSFIVGFPGEEEEDFNMLLEFAEASASERIGVFAYSPEENTPAYSLRPRVPEGVAEQRREMLMDISDRNLETYHKKILNSQQPFLPLGPWESHTSAGRIWSQAPEVDGLTRVQTPFGEVRGTYPIRLTGFKHEILEGEKI